MKEKFVNILTTYIRREPTMREAMITAFNGILIAFDNGEFKFDMKTHNRVGVSLAYFDDEKKK